MYYVNPAAYTGITVVPSEIIRKSIKFASANQLKVMLAVCMLSTEGFDAAKIAAASGVSEENTQDALLFWKEKGLVTEAGEQTVPVEKPEEKAETPSHQKKDIEQNSATKAPMIDFTPEKLTREQIAIRLTESAELRELMNAVQPVIGRTLGMNDQSSLILLHDYYGLDAGIILIICEYARLHSKSGSINYIFSTGVNWSKREIDTPERAHEELERLESTSAIWQQFRTLTGGVFSAVPTEAQRETVGKWIENWKLTDTVIKLAFDEMQTNTGKASIPYMDKVLAAWYQAGATTPEKIEKYKQDFEDKKNAGKGVKKRKEAQPDSNKGASYDIEQAVKQATENVPTATKRKRGNS